MSAPPAPGSSAPWLPLAERPDDGHDGAMQRVLRTAAVGLAAALLLSSPACAPRFRPPPGTRADIQNAVLVTRVQGLEMAPDGLEVRVQGVRLALLLPNEAPSFEASVARLATALQLGAPLRIDVRDGAVTSVAEAPGAGAARPTALEPPPNDPGLGLIRDDEVAAVGAYASGAYAFFYRSARGDLRVSLRREDFVATLTALVMAYRDRRPLRVVDTVSNEILLAP